MLLRGPDSSTVNLSRTDTPVYISWHDYDYRLQIPSPIFCTPLYALLLLLCVSIYPTDQSTGGGLLTAHLPGLAGPLRSGHTELNELVERRREAAGVSLPRANQAWTSRNQDALFEELFFGLGVLGSVLLERLVLDQRHVGAVDLSVMATPAPVIYVRARLRSWQGRTHGSIMSVLVFVSSYWAGPFHFRQFHFSSSLRSIKSVPFSCRSE